MVADYSPIIPAVRREGLRATQVLLIETSTPIRMWGGNFNFATTADDELDPSGIYSGDGTWLSAPRMSAKISGAAESGQLTFADTDLTQSLMESAGAGVIGKKVRLGRVYLGADWQPIAPVVWTWALIAGRPQLAWHGNISGITLNVLPDAVDRSRSGTRYWTDAGHRSRHPTCSFLKWRKRYNGVYRPKWD